MSPRVIHSEACLTEGADWLRAADPRLAPALEEPLPLRLRTDGFDALCHAIVSQQVSNAAAAAIWARIVAAGLTTPAAIAAADDDALRACGLSRPKLRYVRALAAADIDWPALRAMPTAEVVNVLTALPGIGRWTAEVYAIFSLGHADAFAPGDLALQEGARLLLNLPARPTPAVLDRIAADWAPWRSVAARALWAYYGRQRMRPATP